MIIIFLALALVSCASFHEKAPVEKTTKELYENGTINRSR